MVSCSSKKTTAFLRLLSEFSIEIPDSLVGRVNIIKLHKNKLYVGLRTRHKILVYDTTDKQLKSILKFPEITPNGRISYLTCLSEDTLLLGYDNGREVTVYLYPISSQKPVPLNLENHINSYKQNTNKPEAIGISHTNNSLIHENWFYVKVYRGFFVPPGVKPNPSISMILKYNLHTKKSTRLPIYEPEYLYKDTIWGSPHNSDYELVTKNGIYMVHGSSDSIYFYPHGDESNVVVTRLPSKELPTVIKATPTVSAEPKYYFKTGDYSLLLHDSSNQLFLRCTYLPTSLYDESTGKFITSFLERRASIILADENLTKIGETELPAGSWDVYNSTFSDGKVYIPQRKQYGDAIKTIKISIFEMVREQI
jgi:hypothetical protein